MSAADSVKNNVGFPETSHMSSSSPRFWYLYSEHPRILLRKYFVLRTIFLRFLGYPHRVYLEAPSVLSLLVSLHLRIQYLDTRPVSFVLLKKPKI